MANKKLKLLLAFHCHQPVGNFDIVFEEVYKVSYKPLIETLDKYPIKYTLHYTGPLLEWLEKNKPEYINRLKQIAKSGKVEFLSGSFYESILAVWDEKDSLEQLEKLNNYIRTNFEQEPEGMWLAERIWEPHLPSLISKVGLKYTLVDDWHFKSVGIKEEQLKSYYITESAGDKIFVLPISQKLRYYIPYADLDVLFNYLRKCYEEGFELILMGDDGEKFGAWPGTYEHLYEQGWFDRFFQKALENSDWLEFSTISEAIKECEPAGEVYLPTASYYEMTEWAQPALMQREQEEFKHFLEKNGLWNRWGTFVKGGFWRNFLTKYQESNDIHKRVVQISKLIRNNEEDNIDILRAQCNCAYWHGLFGGIYLPHLRGALWEQLANAEKKLPDRAIMEDIDIDGFDEVNIKKNNQVITIMPRFGGALKEWLLLDRGINFTATMTRRYEAYHDNVTKAILREEMQEAKSIHDVILTKEKGLEKYLNYDWHRRLALQVHFLRDDTNVDNFASVKYGEEGDFTLEKWEAQFLSDDEVLLFRKGGVWTDGEFLPCMVKKQIKVLPDNTLKVKWTIINLSQKEVVWWFGHEFSVFVPDLIDVQTDFRKFDGFNNLDLGYQESFMINFHRGKFRMENSTPMIVWTFPIWTVSLSDAGFEKTLQGLVTLTSNKIHLRPGQEWFLEQNIRVK